jgi:methylthioribose-1-phosphate isomerase/methylthioribulose-1-phosphate dehydratase
MTAMLSHISGIGHDLAAAAARCRAQGWMPATAGNLSVRLDADHLLITPSGVDKGRLHPDDLITVAIGTGRALDPASMPSAETGIHAEIYRRTDARCVVHAHPLHATALASVLGTRRQMTEVCFDGYELVKVLHPQHQDGPVSVPILPNHPAVARIAAATGDHLACADSPVPAILIEGHGATTWGADLDQATVRMECVDALSALAITVGAALHLQSRPATSCTPIDSSLRSE